MIYHENKCIIEGNNRIKMLVYILHADNEISSGHNKWYRYMESIASKWELMSLNAWSIKLSVVLLT